MKLPNRGAEPFQPSSPVSFVNAVITELADEPLAHAMAWRSYLELRAA